MEEGRRVYFNEIEKIGRASAFAGAATSGK
jgi:hypothetical protein